MDEPQRSRTEEGLVQVQVVRPPRQHAQVCREAGGAVAGGGFQAGQCGVQCSKGGVLHLPAAMWCLLHEHADGPEMLCMMLLQ